MTYQQGNSTNLFWDRRKNNVTHVTISFRADSYNFSLFLEKFFLLLLPKENKNLIHQLLLKEKWL